MVIASGSSQSLAKQLSAEDQPLSRELGLHKTNTLLSLSFHGLYFCALMGVTS